MILILIFRSFVTYQMVYDMRQDSPLNSPSHSSGSPTLEIAENFGNDWQMTNTLDNKSFLSNIVSTKADTFSGK